MFSLFQMLFKKSYWSMLLRGATWHEGWLSLKRFHKDKRARKHIRGLFFLLLTPFLCLIYLGWLIGTRAIIFVPLVAPVIWWMNRRKKHEEVPHIVAPPTAIVSVLSEEEKISLRSFVADLGLYYAIMANRAGSESFVKQKVLPEGIEITSRRVLLDLLHSRNLWERMSREDREAMLQADGHWEWPLIHHVALVLEQVRLLRWILELDFYLPLVGQQLTNDYRIAQELVQEPQKLYDGSKLRDLDNIRIGRDAADGFFHRCLAEALARGYYTTSDEKLMTWAQQVSSELQGKQHEDQVLGHQIVADATEETVRWAILLSDRRRNFLNWILNILEKGESMEALPAIVPSPVTEEAQTSGER